jgi:hypothetical protein
MLISYARFWTVDHNFAANRCTNQGRLRKSVHRQGERREDINMPVISMASILRQ